MSKAILGAILLISDIGVVVAKLFLLLLLLYCGYNAIDMSLAIGGWSTQSVFSNLF